MYLFRGLYLCLVITRTPTVSDFSYISPAMEPTQLSHIAVIYSIDTKWNICLSLVSEPTSLRDALLRRLCPDVGLITIPLELPIATTMSPP